MESLTHDASAHIFIYLMDLLHGLTAKAGAVEGGGGQAEEPMERGIDLSSAASAHRGEARSLA